MGQTAGIELSSARSQLADCKQDDEVSIVRISADKSIKKRLLGMGLVKGVSVRVIQKRGSAIVVAFDASRIAIDSEMSRHIEVKTLATRADGEL